MSVRRERRGDPKTGKDRKFWMVDIKYREPDGQLHRVRRVSPVQTKRGAEQLERQIRQALMDKTFGSESKEVPRFNEFADEFEATYVKSNNKESEQSAKRSHLKYHLRPVLGRLRLDEVKIRQVEQLKADLIAKELAPKTVNNVLAVLSKMMRYAVEVEILKSAPRIKLLRVPEQQFDFLTFDEAERLVKGADGQWTTTIFLAMRTGLRQGELRRLSYDHVDLVAGRLVVRESAWKQTVGTPKSGRSREVPLSPETVDALKSHRHLRGRLVFCQQDGSMLTEGMMKWPIWRACDRAGLRRIRWHVLRHTFASHLVMRGVPLKTVQELMGHSDIRMTMRYAHLAPEVKDDAVRLLDQRGKIGATGEVPVAK